MLDEAKKLSIFQKVIEIQGSVQGLKLLIEKSDEEFIRI